jgi:ADP-ribose pyrophosphatase YjhB (NUDIX family)
MRPGYGEPLPALRAALAGLSPVTSETVRWPGGLVLAVDAYIGAALDVPEEFVTSVRCLTTVDGAVVACEVPGAVHVWPGGRRELGETFPETASRELLEETGWLLEEASVRQVGFLHLQHCSPVPEGHPFPHPDFFQVVVAGSARQHVGDPSAWRDTEGWESRSWLVAPDEVADLPVSAAERAFVALITGDR